MITIAGARSDEQILAARAVMLQLRHPAAVRVSADGAADAVRAVAGHRFMEILHSGKIL